MVLFIGNLIFGIIHQRLKIWYYSMKMENIKNKKFGIIHWKQKTLKIKNWYYLLET